MLVIKDAHSMEEYLELLRMSDTIFIDYKRLDQALVDCENKSEDLARLATLIMKIDSAGSFSDLSRDSLIDYFYSQGVDIDKYCKLKGVNSYSVDAKRVLPRIYASDYCNEFLDTYLQYISYSHYTSFLRGLWDRQLTSDPPETIITEQGRRLLGYKTTVAERQNFRTYYNDIAVVSIPRIYSSVVTVPDEEHFIAHVDYPQADWRVAYSLFISNPEFDKLIDGISDAYRWIPTIMGESPSDEDYKRDRSVYKVDTLKTFYNSRDNGEIPTKLRKFFNEQPKYKEMIRRLYILQKMGIPIPTESYFGFQQYLPASRIPNDFVSKGVNTPVQTFTSHLVAETSFGVIKKFRDLGYSEEDIKMYYNRHDEPLFLCHKRILKDAWVFGDCSTVHVDGFPNFPLEFFFGYYYKDPDEQLTRLINLNIENNRNKFEEVPKGDRKEYSPIPSVEEVYAKLFKTPENQLMLKLESMSTSSSKLVKLADSITDDMLTTEYISEHAPSYIADFARNPQYLLVYHDCPLFEPTMSGDTYLHFRRERIEQYEVL